MIWSSPGGHACGTGPARSAGTDRGSPTFGGIYIAVFRLLRGRTITVGRLGRFDFAPGLYYYVGSAQRNLQARIARHARKRKPLRWHIDYLSTRAEMLGAILIDAPRSEECRLAADLARRMPPAIPGFGASDCHCGGHLFCEADPAAAPE